MESRFKLRILPLKHRVGPWTQRQSRSLYLYPSLTPAGGEVDGASISAGSYDDDEADDKGGEWLLRFTAEVQRIDRD